MTSSEEKSYFSTLQEQLESKNVVTFKWLSRKCKIHSTLARQLLEEFINASGKNKYTVTYLVFCKDPNGNLLISLTDESDLNNAVDNSSVVDTQIYSIECNSSNISTNTLYNEEKLSFQLEQMDLSSISYPSKVNKNPNLRRLSSLATNKEKNKEETSEKSSTSSVKVEPKKEKKNKLNFTALPKTKNEEKTENKIEDNVPKNPPAEIETESKTKNTKGSKAPVTGKGPLSMLFQNHRVKSASNSSFFASSEDKVSEVKIENPDSKEDKAETVKETQSQKRQSVKRSSPVNTNKIQVKTTKRNTAKSKKKTEKKKRKRVSAAFETSSDESDNDSNSSDKESPFDQMEEEPGPERESEQPAEPEPAICVVQGRKRKRKVVSKSVVDDDGFFYTEKKVVYESCDSDDNDENDRNMNQDPNKRLKINKSESNMDVTKTNIVPPTAEKNNMKKQKAKSKQASIMNFFKKS